MTARARRALAVLLVCGLSSVAAGCDRERAPGDWVAEPGFRWRSVHPRGGDGFERFDAPSRGIDFIYDVPEERRYENRILAEGAGVAIGDVDGDGLADLFFAGFGGPSALFLNRGGWRFERAPPGALALGRDPVRGAALADVDGDGDLDLLLSLHGAPNRLYANDGSGRFTLVPDAGFEVARGSTTLALADIDGDGDLDLYVANYKTRQADDLLTPEERAALHRLSPGPDGKLDVPPRIAEHYHLEFDGRFVRWWELGETDELYLNDGSGRFESVPVLERLRAEETLVIGDSLRDWGLTARFSDWDGDGDPDLYVANDFNSPDGIWVNQGDGRFRAASALAVRTTSLSSMAVDFSDVERDGDLDILTTDMLARDPGLRLRQVPSFTPEPDPPGVVETRREVNRNALQLNRGDGTFAEAARWAGLAASDWTWGALFLDVDLDGYEDLLVTTGHAWDQLDAATQERAAASGAVDRRHQLALFPELRQRNVAFRARGDGTFEDASEAWDWAGEPDISHGLATGDLDADGDLDVVVTRLGEPPLLLETRSDAPRVLVRLDGPAGNRFGVGARVTLAGHPAGEQIDHIQAGGSYLSSSEPAVVFAAPAEGAAEIEVRWPDGERSLVGAVRGDREYVIEHPSVAGSSGPGTPAGGEPARGDPLRADGHPAPLLMDVSDLLSHRHVESSYDDRARQPLLPYSLARLGPGVSWIDVDRDGDPDLLVGSGRGGSPVLLRNRGGTFDPARSVTPALAYDATTILPAPADGTGEALLIGASAYEAASPEEAIAVPAVLRVRLGAGAVDPVPAVAGSRPPSATGPLAQADVDGDGDLDLFVGGRAVPSVVPLPAASRLLLAEGGRLEPDAASAPLLEALGMVAGAVFADFDGDADPDLALALEWGSVRLLRNEGGRFVDATAAAGLAGLSGRWNAIDAGDFDGDGALDLVVTGWGANVAEPPAYSVFFGDFDRNGSFDLVEAVRVGDGWRPLRRWDELARGGIPAIARIPPPEYASASLDRILGAGFDPSARVEVRELRHLVLMNRGGRFEASPLPTEAQLSPSLGMAVVDLDGDGHEDLVMSQNFYPVGRGVPRYDAGRGLWLRGDGTGRFEAVPAARSGIEAYGDGRAVAVADYDGDRRPDVAMGVNGGETRLLRNTGGRPGLRVVLRGGGANPDGIGAAVRVEYGDGTLGPARAVRSGSGHWSRDEAAMLLGLAARPAALRVRWPWGGETRHPVPPGADSVTIDREGS